MLWLTLAGLASLVIGVYLMGKVFSAWIGGVAVACIIGGAAAMLISLALFVVRVFAQ